MKIKHISFDVWKTLIEPNPEFGRARKLLLEATLDKPAAEIEAAYRVVKDGADGEAEAGGVGYTSAQVYARLLNELGVSGADWWMLRAHMEDLFAAHPPIVRPDVPEVLRELRAAGYGMSIASNTNFIQGTCLSSVALDAWGVDWTFKVFSDQMGLAKPHALFWHAVTAQAYLLSGAEASEILHVGDNRICDGGCRDFGLNYQFVNSPADVPGALSGLLQHEQAA